METIAVIGLGSMGKRRIRLLKNQLGKKVIGIYSHEGYKKATNDDYKSEIKAQELMKANS